MATPIKTSFVRYLSYLWPDILVDNPNHKVVLDLSPNRFLMCGFTGKKQTMSHYT